MEEEYDFCPPQKVSYLQARDPSILSWNRHGIEKVRHNLQQDFSENTTVASLPLSEKEEHHVKVYLRVKGGIKYDDLYTVANNTLTCKIPEGSYVARNNKDGTSMIKKYEFTRIFGPKTKQGELFHAVIKEKILSFINGQNSTLMAYGASGAGKTFTMVGSVEEPGVIPRALEYLFRTLPPMEDKPYLKPRPNGEVELVDDNQKLIEKKAMLSIVQGTTLDGSLHVRTYKAMQQRLSNDPVASIETIPPILNVWVSFAEIYNENIYDLLQAAPARGQQRNKLRIGGLSNTYIRGLKYIHVRSGLEAYQVLQYGLQNLKYASTAVNMHSSRSHCIFSVQLVQGYDVDNATVSSFNFCDLAGSERVKKTLNVGDRLKESNNINNSLSVLGRCINNIRDGQCHRDNQMPPFRESKLTQLFQTALMGKEEIVMIVNINPSKDMFDETHHTLNFSAVAKEIIIENNAPVKFLRPNRFSNRLENNELLPYIEEDERDEELRQLRDEYARIVLEHSEFRQQVEDLMDEERNTFRKTLDQVVELKDAQINRLKQRNLELTKLKREYERKEFLQKMEQLQKEDMEDSDDDVIVLSDEEGGKESKQRDEEIKNLKKLLEEKMEEINGLKAEFRRLEEENKKISELQATIEDAKSDFLVLLEENKELKRVNQELMCKTMLLEEKVTIQSEEIDELMVSRRLCIEELEQLEEEKQILEESISENKENIPNSEVPLHVPKFSLNLKEQKLTDLS